MKITNETELMYNQKGSLVIAPDKQFEALQTIEGYSLLFSIGLDGILFCTREVPGDTHGWVRVDLSSTLSNACYNGATVTAKTFDIAQDLINTNSVDIALVVTVNGIDYLHIVTGFENTLDNWTSNIPVFDDTTQYKVDYGNISANQAMPVNEVQILDSNDGNGTQYIIVDLVSDPASQTLSRFYIDTTKQHGYAWLPHNLQATLEAGKVSSFIGCGPNDGPNNDYNVGGVYVLGTVNNTAQLFYTPTCNYLHPEEHAESTIFNLPAGYSSEYMAMALSAPAATAPYTDMFFASNGTLYFLANADQIDTETTNPTPQAIYTHELFNNIQNIHVKNWNDNIVLWGQSLSTDGTGTSQLFIMEGVAGQETNAAAWSTPITLLLNVENASAYVNNTYSLDTSIDSANGNAYGSCNVLFAHQSDGTLVKLFQDPVTSAWQERHILTVPNTYLDMYENETYTTHINITDNNNVPQPGITAYIWSSSPTSVYVNNVYTTLEFDSPFQTTADELGIINITQPVDSIGGISYYIAVQDPTTTSPTYQQWTTEVINPIAVTNANIAKQVPDGNTNYVGGTVPDEQGAPQNLAGSGSSSDQQLQTSQSIDAFGQHNSDINADGLTADKKWPDPATAIAALQSAITAKLTVAGVHRHGKIQRTKKFAKADRLAKHLRFDAAKDKIWGATFGKNGKHYEGHEAMQEMGLVVNADGSLALKLSNGNLVGSSNWLEAKAGHLFKWMKSEAHKLEAAVIKLGEDGLDCLLTIAGSVYHFVVKCMNDIANSIHTALNAIESAFKNLISWIGSLFAWGDIKRTHQVLRQMFTTYAKNCINNIGNIQAQLNYAGAEAIAAIDSWAQLPNDTFPQDSYPTQNAGVDQTKGQHSPSANWGHHHVGNNAANADCAGSGSDVGDLLKDFFTAIEVEADIIIQAVDQLKEVLSNASSMPLDQLIRQIVAIIADALINSTVNVVDTLLTAAEQIIGDVVETTLAQAIHIPVLSSLYKKFTGDELSILDLICLVVAIPVNVIYKVANNMEAPFPDNSSTTALINATNFSEFITAAGNVQGNPESVAAVNTKLQDSDGWSDGTNKFWTIISNSCALGGSIAISILGCLKIKFDKSYLVAVGYSAAYLPYIAPNIFGVIQQQYYKDAPKYWFNWMNEGLADAGFIKSFIDIKLTYNNNNPTAPKPVVAADDLPIDVPPASQNPWSAILSADPGPTKGWKKPFKNADGESEFSWNDASPFVEAAINLAWEVPVVFAYLEAKKKPDFDLKANILQCTGNTMFNFGGVIAPISTFGPAPANIIVAGCAGFNELGLRFHGFCKYVGIVISLKRLTQNIGQPFYILLEI